MPIAPSARTSSNRNACCRVWNQQTTREVQPVLLAKLLDQYGLVASATRGGDGGWAIVSEDSIGWIATGSAHSPLSAEDIFHLFVGRSLLRTFN